MLVRDAMTSHVITISMDATLGDVQQVFEAGESEARLSPAYRISCSGFDRIARAIRASARAPADPQTGARRATVRIVVDLPMRVQPKPLPRVARESRVRVGVLRVRGVALVDRSGPGVTIMTPLGLPPGGCRVGWARRVRLRPL